MYNHNTNRNGRYDRYAKPLRPELNERRTGDTRWSRHGDRNGDRKTDHRNGFQRYDTLGSHKEDAIATEPSAKRVKADSSLQTRQNAIPSSEPQNHSNGSNEPQTDTSETTNSTTESEKVRLRRLKLEQWKRKKAEEKARETRDTSEGASTGSASPTPVAVTPAKKAGFGFSLKKDGKRKLHKQPAAGTAEFSNGGAKLPGFTTSETTAPPEPQNPEPQSPENTTEDPLDALVSSMLRQDPQNDPSRDDTETLLDSDGESGTATNSLDPADPADPADDPAAILARLEQKKRKDIPVVDHSKMSYEPFRKNFYTEPEELRHMSASEADALRLHLDGIKIRGADCPKPVLKWSQLGLPAATMSVLADLGYSEPSPIQAQALPAIMAGRDVIGVAKTGSGKTLAFLLPMFRQLQAQRPLGPRDGPLAIVLTPTRELAAQIHKTCRPFLRATGLRAVCAYGGAPISEHIAALKRGAEIAVCTPGRLIDLLAANGGRVTNLARVTYLVLDEADRLFDMGFEPQVMRIVRNIRPDRQTVLFSATFPAKMESLAKRILTKPVEILVGARGSVAPEVRQIVEVIPEERKLWSLLALLGRIYSEDPDTRVLIFVDRQSSADDLLSQLLRHGYLCQSVHGGKEQIDRDAAVAEFKRGETPILVATSVAARGLDVKQLDWVVNYDAPSHLEDYVHRAGRTGRAGRSGTAVTYVEPGEDRSAFDIAKALRLSGAEIPRPLQELADVFAEKMRAGKEQLRSGFGGKGLDKLDAERVRSKQAERSKYEGEEGGGAANGGGSGAANGAANGGSGGAASGAAGSTESASSSSSSYESILALVRSKIRMESDIVEGAAPENRGPDQSEYHANFEINDLPQRARWSATSNATHKKVIEESGSSITIKGQYIPPDKNGKSVAADGKEKLHLLIEGPTKLAVSLAVNQLRDIVVQSLVQNAVHEARGTQGRYTV